MKTTITTLSKLLAAATLLAGVGLVQAVTTQTNTANIPVSAAISAKCTISATGVAFGDYDPASTAAKTATGSVTVGCTKGAAGMTIGLGNGSSAVAGTRTMVGAAAADLLQYSLLQPVSATPGAACSTTTAWTTDSPFALATSAGKAPLTYNVCGVIAAGQDQSIGAYTDTVVATVNF